MITINNAGNCVITANQAAAGRYGPGSVNTTFTVKLYPTIGPLYIPSKTFGEIPF